MCVIRKKPKTQLETSRESGCENARMDVNWRNVLQRMDSPCQTKNARKAWPPKLGKRRPPVKSQRASLALRSKPNRAIENLRCRWMIDVIQRNLPESMAIDVGLTPFSLAHAMRRRTPRIHQDKDTHNHDTTFVNDV